MICIKKFERREGEREREREGGREAKINGGCAVALERGCCTLLPPKLKGINGCENVRVRRGVEDAVHA